MFITRIVPTYIALRLSSFLARPLILLLVSHAFSPYYAVTILSGFMQSFQCFLQYLTVPLLYIFVYQRCNGVWNNAAGHSGILCHCQWGQILFTFFPFPFSLSDFTTSMTDSSASSISNITQLRKPSRIARLVIHTSILWIFKSQFFWSRFCSRPCIALNQSFPCFTYNTVSFRMLWFLTGLVCHIYLGQLIAIFLPFSIKISMAICSPLSSTSRGCSRLFWTSISFVFPKFSSSSSSHTNSGEGILIWTFVKFILYTASWTTNCSFRIICAPVLAHIF